MSDKKPGRGSDQFPLRLPDGMRDMIKEAADKNGRSMNAEIIARLSDSLMGDSLVATTNFDRLLQLVADIAADKASQKTIERLYEYERLPPEEKDRYVQAFRADEEGEKQKREPKPKSLLDQLPDSVLALVDTWISRQPDPKPTREEAISTIIMRDIIKSEKNSNDDLPSPSSPSKAVPTSRPRRKIAL